MRLELPRLGQMSEHHGLAAVLDVETTGFSQDQDEVVEFAIILFAFERATGRVVGIVDEYSGLRDPGRSIPGSATRVHGITDEMVAGKRLDADRVMAIMDRAERLIAHNARFDQGFVARLFPQCADMPWLCSCWGIDWRRQGHANAKLATLLRAYDLADEQDHRGGSDCLATLALLALDGTEGRPNLAELLGRSGLISAPEQRRSGIARQ